MAGVAFAVEGDGVGFATESYAASALCTTLASLSGALWRIRRAKGLEFSVLKEELGINLSSIMVLTSLRAARWQSRSSLGGPAGSQFLRAAGEITKQNEGAKTH
jgi:hypothetical protein